MPFSGLQLYKNVLYIICFLYSGNDFKEDSHSFLFSLVNPSGSRPARINRKPGGYGGIHCETGIGPCFGHEHYFNLTVIVLDVPGIFHCRVFDQGTRDDFQSPSEVAFTTYFTGEDTFAVSELEVFKVNF